MIKAIIIDDERGNRKTLEMLLHQHFPDIEIVAHAENVKTGIEKVQELAPQILFLDIQMPDGSGFDLLRKVKNYNFEIIFTTAHDEYALDAFRHFAIGYLLKPIAEEELRVTVQKVIELVQNRQGNHEEKIKALIDNFGNHVGKQHKIILPDADGYQIIATQEIIYLEGERNYTQIFLTSKKSLLSSGVVA